METVNVVVVVVTKIDLEVFTISSNFVSIRAAKLNDERHHKLRTLASLSC